MALERETAAYNAMLADLLLKEAGRFVLIRGEKLEGVYDTYEAALAAGYENGLEDAFLVRKIAPAERVAYFTRDQAFACQPSR